jgi:hypothetical protein
MAASGWFSSWAMPDANSARLDRRAVCCSSSSRSRALCAAWRSALMSVAMSSSTVEPSTQPMLRRSRWYQWPDSGSKNSVERGCASSGGSSRGIRQHSPSACIAKTSR